MPKPIAQRYMLLFFLPLIFRLFSVENKQLRTTSEHKKTILIVVLLFTQATTSLLSRENLNQTIQRVHILNGTCSSFSHKKWYINKTYKFLLEKKNFLFFCPTLFCLIKFLLFILLFFTVYADQQFGFDLSCPSIGARRLQIYVRWEAGNSLVSTQLLLPLW